MIIMKLKASQLDKEAKSAKESERMRQEHLTLAQHLNAEIKNLNSRLADAEERESRTETEYGRRLDAANKDLSECKIEKESTIRELNSSHHQKLSFVQSKVQGINQALNESRVDDKDPAKKTASWWSWGKTEVSTGSDNKNLLWSSEEWDVQFLSIKEEIFRIRDNAAVKIKNIKEDYEARSARAESACATRLSEFQAKLQSLTSKHEQALALGRTCEEKSQSLQQNLTIMHEECEQQISNLQGKLVETKAEYTEKLEKSEQTLKKSSSEIIQLEKAGADNVSKADSLFAGLQEELRICVEKYHMLNTTLDDAMVNMSLIEDERRIVADINKKLKNIKSDHDGILLALHQNHMDEMKSSLNMQRQDTDSKCNESISLLQKQHEEDLVNVEKLIQQQCIVNVSKFQSLADELEERIQNSSDLHQAVKGELESEAEALRGQLKESNKTLTAIQAIASQALREFSAITSEVCKANSVEKIPEDNTHSAESKASDESAWFTWNVFATESQNPSNQDGVNTTNADEFAPWAPDTWSARFKTLNTNISNMVDNIYADAAANLTTAKNTYNMRLTQLEEELQKERIEIQKQNNTCASLLMEMKSMVEISTESQAAITTRCNFLNESIKTYSESQEAMREELEQLRKQKNKASERLMEIEKSSMNIQVIANISMARLVKLMSNAYTGDKKGHELGSDFDVPHPLIFDAPPTSDPSSSSAPVLLMWSLENWSEQFANVESELLEMEKRMQIHAAANLTRLEVGHSERMALIRSKLYQATNATETELKQRHDTEPLHLLPNISSSLDNITGDHENLPHVLADTLEVKLTGFLKLFREMEVVTAESHQITCQQHVINLTTVYQESKQELRPDSDGNSSKLIERGDVTSEIQLFAPDTLEDILVTINRVCNTTSPKSEENAADINSSSSWFEWSIFSGKQTITSEQDIKKETRFSTSNGRWTPKEWSEFFSDVKRALSQMIDRIQKKTAMDQITMEAECASKLAALGEHSNMSSSGCRNDLSSLQNQMKSSILELRESVNYFEIYTDQNENHGKVRFSALEDYSFETSKVQWNESIVQIKTDIRETINSLIAEAAHNVSYALVEKEERVQALQQELRQVKNEGMMEKIELKNQCLNNIKAIPSLVQAPDVEVIGGLGSIEMFEGTEPAVRKAIFEVIELVQNGIRNEIASKYLEAESNFSKNVSDLQNELERCKNETVEHQQNLLSEAKYVKDLVDQTHSSIYHIHECVEETGCNANASITAEDYNTQNRSTESSSSSSSWFGWTTSHLDSSVNTSNQIVNETNYSATNETTVEQMRAVRASTTKLLDKIMDRVKSWQFIISVSISSIEDPANQSEQTNLTISCTVFPIVNCVSSGMPVQISKVSIAEDIITDHKSAFENESQKLKEMLEKEQSLRIQAERNVSEILAHNARLSENAKFASDARKRCYDILNKL